MKKLLAVVKLTFIFLLTLMMIISCASTKKRGAKKDNFNLTNIYNPGSTPLHPEFMVYHSFDSTSLLLSKIFPTELLFNQANPQHKTQASLQISYQMIDISTNLNNKQICDSASHNFYIDISKLQKRFFAFIPIKAKDGKKYLLTVTTNDLLRKTMQRTFLIVDKTNELNSQNFEVISRYDNFPIFSSYTDSNEVFSIHYRQGNSKNAIFIKYYKSEQPVPPPAFFPTPVGTRFDKPDSIWKYPFSDSIAFKLPYKGMYFFQMDTSQNKGLTLFNFGTAYPRVLRANQMIGPLQYLTNSSEFEALKSISNSKTAVDNFWLKTSKNIDVSRELIRVFYNRVFFSNYYFTADREGWKTDRGMIYIIYGLPNNLVKKPDEEIWSYYDKSNPQVITFSFKKMDNPFSNNFYVLQRGENLTTHWRQAVDAWRHGKVYNLGEEQR